MFSELLGLLIYYSVFVGSFVAGNAASVFMGVDVVELGHRFLLSVKPIWARGQLYWGNIYARYRNQPVPDTLKKE